MRYKEVLSLPDNSYFWKINANQTWLQNGAYLFHRLFQEISAALLPYQLFPPFWRDGLARTLIDSNESVVHSSGSSEVLRKVLEYPKVILSFLVLVFRAQCSKKVKQRDVYICWISYFHTWNHPWLSLKRKRSGTKVFLDGFGVASVRETTRRHFFSTWMHNYF